MKTNRSNIRQLVITLSALCASLATVAADTFNENFNSPTLNTNLVVASTNGFSLVLSGGRGSVSKQGGTGNGSLRATTAFEVRGDFTATVQAGRASLGSQGELGLWVDTSSDYADVFFYGDGQINANLFTSHGYGARVVSQSAAAVSFRIRRVGATLFLEYDAGAGFQILHSGTDAVMADPVKVGIFLIEEYGSTVARSGWFDNLVITADQMFPQPVSGFSATIQTAAVLVSWPSNTNSTYQVEYNSSLTTNIWTPLGLPMPGTGSTMSVTNWIIGQPQGFYRVVDLP